VGGVRNPRLEAEAGNGGNALEERRWAWEFDPKPSGDCARKRSIPSEELLLFPADEPHPVVNAPVLHDLPPSAT
jgi:hypothetical protein